MVKRAHIFLAGIFLLFALSSFASALNTTLIIHGPPFHSQIVRVLDPTTKAVITSVYPGEHYTGVTESSFLTTKTQVTFLIIDRYDRKTYATYENFEDYLTGGTIELWLPGAFNNSLIVDEEQEVLMANQTEDNETISLNESEDDASLEGKKTRFTISGMVGNIEKGLNNKYVYYVGGGIFGIFLLLFIIMWVRKIVNKRKKSKEKKFYSDAGSPLSKINDVEKKMSEIEKDLEELKNAEMIRLERRRKLIERRNERVRNNKN